jgi:hypothetical protein
LTRIVPVVDEQKTGFWLQSTLAAGSLDGAVPAGLGVGGAEGAADAEAEDVGVALGGNVSGGAVMVLWGVGVGLRAIGSFESHLRIVSAVPMIPAATMAAKTCTNFRCIKVSPVRCDRQHARPAASCCFA